MRIDRYGGRRGNFQVKFIYLERVKKKRAFDYWRKGTGGATGRGR